MSILLLLTLSVGAGRANEPVTLKLRPAAEVGPQVITAEGPEGQRAVEVIGGPQQSKITLLAFDAPENMPSNFVLRGKMKATAIDGTPLLNAKSMLLLRSEIVTDTGTGFEDSPGHNLWRRLARIRDWLLLQRSEAGRAES